MLKTSSQINYYSICLASFKLTVTLFEHRLGQGSRGSTARGLRSHYDVFKKAL